MDLVNVTGTENIRWRRISRRRDDHRKRGARAEVVDLAECLKAMAQNKGAGSDVIRITGVPRLKAASYRVMPDRIETGTFCGGAATGGEVRLRDKRATYSMRCSKNCLKRARISRRTRTRSAWAWGGLRAVNLRTAPYPAFPTECRRQFMALNTWPSHCAHYRNDLRKPFHARQELRRPARKSRSQQYRGVRGVGNSMARPSWRPTARVGEPVIAGWFARGETAVERVYNLTAGTVDSRKALAAGRAHQSRAVVDRRCAGARSNSSAHAFAVPSPLAPLLAA